MSKSSKGLMDSLRGIIEGNRKERNQYAQKV